MRHSQVTSVTRFDLAERMCELRFENVARHYFKNPNLRSKRKPLNIYVFKFLKITANKNTLTIVVFFSEESGGEGSNLSLETVTIVRASPSSPGQVS